METSRRRRLEELMARLAAGDGSVACVLALEFSAPIGAAVRTHLAELGVTDVERNELDGLVVDVCLMLAEVAGAWRADGGASPWHWARHRVRTLVAGWVGQHADPLDDALLDAGPFGAEAPPAPPGDEPDLGAVLDRLAAQVPLVALVREGLDTVASARDRALLLEVGVQGALGDPSPAVTVAALHDMTPEAVRQVLCRARRRLRRLAAADERFAPLADLPLAA
jgi:hypothetical protein